MAEKTYTFNELPETLEAVKALPEAAMKDPYDVAALAILAFHVYHKNPDESVKIINFLKGPQELSAYDKSFLKDRFGNDYLIDSYFVGSTPENSYTPDKPYSFTIFEQTHSRDQFNEGYISLWIRCGGADSPRSMKLRTKPSTGEWFLWEYSGILLSIKTPAKADPWA